MHCIYLRKSQHDLEAEARGEEDVFINHRKTLLDVAASRKLTIGQIYEEVVSGDTISGRPQMRQLLHDIEDGMWEGVLVMDIDRLGRGDSIDQGIILQTLKYAFVRVITPYRDYDLNQDLDEEFFEYNQHMARGEYRRIKRRMWAGRVITAKDGKWQSDAPLGYERYKLRGEKGWSLLINPSEAEAVRLVFTLYAYGDENGNLVGKNTIATRLNSLGYKTKRGNAFTPSAVGTILHNPVYIGDVRWNMRRTRKVMKNGSAISKRVLSPDEYMVNKGRHEPIITKELWDAVVTRLSTNRPPVIGEKVLKNPFAGLIICPLCGYTMIMTPIYDRPVKGAIRCRTPKCQTYAIDVEYVEAAVLNTLRDWSALAEHPTEFVPSVENPVEAQLAKARQNIAALTQQRDRLYELLEQGVYDTKTFVERNRILSERIANAEQSLAALSAQSPISHEEAIRRLKPDIDHLLSTWHTSTPAEQNALLRTVVSKIIYHKTHRCFRNQDPSQYLTLDLLPQIKS